MALKQNTAEGGTNGTVITASAQTAGGSGDQLTLSGSTDAVSFSNAHPAHGSLGYSIVHANHSRTLSFTGYTATQMAIRFYRYFSAIPSVTSNIAAITNTTNTSLYVYINSTGTVRVDDSTGSAKFTSTATLSANTLYRFEASINLGTTSSNGTINFAVYAGDSTTALITFNSSTLSTGAGTTISTVQFGQFVNSTAAYTDYLDDLAAQDGTTTFIGAAGSSNVAPTANAGPDQAGIAAGATVTLNGTGSSDSDGTIASYAWTQTAGTTVTLSSTSTASPTFTAPTSTAQTLTFSLIVTDNLGASSTADTVNIGVLSNSTNLKQNGAEGGTNGTAITAASQTGGASGDQLTRGGTPGTLEFSSAHPVHGLMGYHFVHSASAAATLYWQGYTSSAMAIRCYRYFPALPSATTGIMGIYNSGGLIVAVYLSASGTLTVTDAVGANKFTSSSTLSTATTYRFELVAIPGTTTSNGTINFATYAGDSTTAVSTLSMSAAVTTANTGTTSIINAQFGKLINNTSTHDDYMDDLAASDGATTFIGPAGSGTNQAPTASVGSNQINLEPWSTVMLTGTDSDSDGTVVSRAWSQTSGSPSVSLSGAATATATYTAPGTIAGTTLTFGYQVTDNGGASSTLSTVTNAVLPVTERAVISGSEVPLRIMTTGEVQAQPSQPANYNQIGIIGDSLTKMNGNGPTLLTSQLVSQGWNAGDIQALGVYGMKIAAESGSPTNSTGDIITSWRAGGFDPRVWVMATGINDQFAGSAPFDSIRQAAVQQIYDQIMAGPQTNYVIYWIGFDFFQTSYSRYPEATAFDQTLLGFQTSLTNFHACSIKTYYTSLRSDPNWSSYWVYPTDQLHNTDLGYQTIRVPFYGQCVASEAPS